MSLCDSNKRRIYDNNNDNNKIDNNNNNKIDNKHMIMAIINKKMKLFGMLHTNVPAKSIHSAKCL